MRGELRSATIVSRDARSHERPPIARAVGTVGQSTEDRAFEVHRRDENVVVAE